MASELKHPVLTTIFGYTLVLILLYWIGRKTGYITVTTNFPNPTPSPDTGTGATGISGATGATGISQNDNSPKSGLLAWASTVHTNKPESTATSVEDNVCIGNYMWLWNELEHKLELVPCPSPQANSISNTNNPDDLQKSFQSMLTQVSAHVGDLPGIIKSTDDADKVAKFICLLRNTDTNVPSNLKDYVQTQTDVFIKEIEDAGYVFHSCAIPPTVMEKFQNILDNIGIGNS